jgi:hypothetical protein
MQIFEFDQFEFPDPSGEEHLRLFIESRERNPEIAGFLARCLSSDERASFPVDPPSKSYEEAPWRGEIHKLLAHFAPELAKELPGSRVTTLLLRHDEHTLLITTRYRYVLYEWSSAA